MHGPEAGGRVDGLLAELWQAGGTDLLLTAGMPPQLRVHGQLTAVPGWPPLTGEHTDALLAELLDADQQEAWKTVQEYDFAFSWRTDARVRGNAFTQRGSTTVALRMIPMAVPTMESLGLPPVLSDFARRHQGLVLVTGPTGSGKSTTLAAVVDRINTERACHILTVEDPIEYVHRHKRAAVNQREVGTDTPSFPHALRAALREDPDVLLVGELRDADTIRLALCAAETGHLVLGTLHTASAARTMDRMIDAFPAVEQEAVRGMLAESLQGVIAQTLLPTTDGNGRVAAHELLVATPAVRNLIREGRSAQLLSAMQSGAAHGMQTLQASLTQLLQQGRISERTAREHMP